MGWASGSRVANAIWDGVKEHLTEESRAPVATAIIKALREQDWDTLNESRELIEASPQYHMRDLEYLEDDEELDADDAVQLAEYRDQGIKPGK